VNNLPKVVTRQCPGAESNLRLSVTSGLQVRHVTVRLPSHSLTSLAFANILTATTRGLTRVNGYMPRWFTVNGERASP